jgi:outer membrane protein OmpA-like peptidoglycan-associated protein
VELSSEPVAQIQEGKVTQVELPSSTPTKLPGGFIRVSMYAWTAQLGLAYANGGAQTTVGSLMEKNGVKTKLIVQPDLNKSQVEQIKFAEKLAGGDPNPAEGVHYIIMMGDGSAQYLAGINKALDRLGNEYRAEVIGAIGYSGNSVSGEDACMVPATWVEDPNNAKGGLIAGYLRDGDWNLCLYWANQNGIKNNPDETTYDPDAINWYSTSDHLEAAKAYITDVCEDRKIVENGRITSKPRQRVCVNAVATWTPGDVNVAKQKGGLVKAISTKENAYQMPAVVIGIHKWNVDNAKKVQSFLKAAFEGNDQVKNFDVALNRAGKAAYEIYGEESPAYWVRYFKGVVERDRTGKPVPLGGSRVVSLGDNLVLFGLVEGAGDLNSSMWRATYEGFGKIAQQQYPKLVPEFPSVAQATNTDFLQALAETTNLNQSVELETFDTTGSISEVVARRNYDSQFNTGSATFTPSALRTLDDLYNQLVVGRLSVEIAGHTDNTGNPNANQALSEARANAVEDYLRERAPQLFQGGRVSSEGFGQSQPIADNSTEAGRAKNRRVTITIGNK